MTGGVIVDRRAGSRDLFPLLQAQRIKGLELGDLGYGDVQITGNGPEGCPWLIGIEHKKLPDLAQSIDNGRLVGHQLPGMLSCYQESWLLVEGIWREGSQGLVEVPRGGSWKPMIAGRSGLMAKALYGFLLTCQIKLGIRVLCTGTPSQTAAWLSALIHWWQEKEYEDHRAHLAFDTSSAFTLISKPSLVRRVAKELPGIGWERSGTVARKFGSVVEMVCAPRMDWESIDGIGKGIAKKVVDALEGRER